VTSYLTKKLIKLRSFDRQRLRPQNCPFQSPFTQGTTQFTDGVPHTFISAFAAVLYTVKLHSLT